VEINLFVYVFIAYAVVFIVRQSILFIQLLYFQVGDYGLCEELYKVRLFIFSYVSHNSLWYLYFVTNNVLFLFDNMLDFVVNDRQEVSF